MFEEEIRPNLAENVKQDPVKFENSIAEEHFAEFTELYG
jgi:hypothetical protein